MHLRVLEEISMCPENEPEETRNFGLMAAKECSKALSAPITGHGKSPCFLGVGFLLVAGPAYPWLVLCCVHGVDFLECAF
jgi:hypothetical protein